MSTPSGQPPAFQRLDRKLQEPLYRIGWLELRPIQIEAIHEVLDGHGDIVIAARTASGKTEAAFLPILSRIVSEDEGSVRAIYAGPLKALINDQFLRLERLCEIADIPVHNWHGDVGPAAKQRLLENPSGVLLITPESMESLFVNHAERLDRLFSRLSFVVIDELHAFLGTERGAHLRSLIARLARKSREPVRRVGLSATLGDMNDARRWLQPGQPEDVALIEDHEGKTIRLRILGYVRHDPQDAEPEQTPREVTLETDVFQAFHGKTALIFANRKKTLEECAAFAARESQRRGVPNLFRVHHGSLSKSEREETEEALRSDRPIATICSSTLEMGIDVGTVSSVGQIGPPWTVTSLAQRLGRSGRHEGEASKLHMFIEEDAPAQDGSLIDRLFPKLLHAIATTELVLAKWCEPPEVDRLHLSTLIQQLLSTIKENGGARPDQLFDELVTHGGFSNVDQTTFLQVLRDMGAADLIEQTAEGPLILGLKGEALVKSHDFYAVFQVAREYRVTCQGRHVGDIVPQSSAEERHLILAGRSWKIVEIDHEQRTIVVEPSPGGRAPTFSPSGGVDVHPRVRETMRLLLSREDTPIYLDASAGEMLTAARASARQGRILELPFFQEGNSLVWFTWTGSRIQRTLAALGRLSGQLDPQDRGIALVFDSVEEKLVRAVYTGYLANSPSAEAIAEHCREKDGEKYERYLSRDVRLRLLAREDLNPHEALEVVRRAYVNPSTRSALPR
jgi:ATP-dependent Lhr-like helicase